MAEGEEKLSADEKVRRSVARTLGNALGVLVVLAVVAVWASFGVYQLDPGQAAIILRLGRHVGTSSTPGLNWHLPPPIERRDIVNVDEIERQDFGFRGDEAESGKEQALLEASMQTSDNNIIRLSFVVQYRVKEAFASRYRVAQPMATLRDAAQAAVREVVGRLTIDGVLSEQRGEVEVEAEEILQQILDDYGTGLAVLAVQLQEVQPPEQVRAAFDDVIAASQDASGIVNEAEGYRNELLPGARAEAAELIEAARGYREAKVAESQGKAQRFTALAREYRKAPEVTQTRLYLETMETVLPSVQKVIIGPGTSNVLPLLPLGGNAAGGNP
jgi:membrane protease subunit HflK